VSLYVVIYYIASGSRFVEATPPPPIPILSYLDDDLHLGSLPILSLLISPRGSSQTHIYWSYQIDSFALFFSIPALLGYENYTISSTNRNEFKIYLNYFRNNPGNADKAAEEFIETSKMLKVT
jgi:hypothetical protein